MSVHRHHPQIAHLPQVLATGTGGLGWSPISLGVSLVAWYRAQDDTIGPLYTDGAAVGTVSDISGNGSDLTSAGANRPTFKTNQLNGNACYRYTAASTTYSQGTFTYSQPCTHLMVIKQRGTPANNDTFCDGGGGSSGQIYDAGPGTITANAGSAALGISRPAVGTVLKISAFFSGASSSMTINGTTATGNPGTNNPAGFTLGAYAGILVPSDIDAFDVALVGRQLTATELLYWSAYVLRTYGV